MLLVHAFVSYYDFTIKIDVQHQCLSWGHDREKGGECCENEYECHRNKHVPFLMEFLCFGRKIPSLLNF